MSYVRNARPVSQVGAIEPARSSKLSAIENVLPFSMTKRDVVNPAAAAWRAASSKPGGKYLLAPKLDVFSHAPADAKAVVYVFHGGKGSADQWITGEEEAALVGDLVREKYAVVLLESTHRPVDRNWFFPDPERFDPDHFESPVTPPSMRDAWNATVNANEQLVRNVHALLNYDTSTKLFLVGFSSGAKFASAMAYNLKLAPPLLGDYYYQNPRTDTAGALNVRAAAIYNNVGVPFYFGNYQADPGLAEPLPIMYETPTIFNYGVNDTKNPVAEVETNVSFLESRQVPVEANRGEPQPLSADRFARVLGVSFVESRDLYAALVPGFVDANGFVTPEADKAQAVLRLPADKEIGVTEQLKVLRAEHHVSSQYHERTVAFFEAHL